jgi:hypothetical protein
MPATRDVQRPPTDADLLAQLGPAGRAFTELLASLPGAQREWRQYGRRSGWVLKLVRGSRTLCYVQPQEGAFRTTVVLGQAAADAARASAVSPAVKEAIRSARVYVEGRSVAVVVRHEKDLADVQALLAAKLAPAPKKR